MRTDLNLITDTTDGNKKTNKLSYVNPNASNAQLSTLAQRVASLSADTLTGATKTDTTELSVASQPIPVTIEGKYSSEWADQNHFTFTTTQLAQGQMITFYLKYNQDNPYNPDGTGRNAVYDTYNNNTQFSIRGNSPYPISIARLNPIVQSANNKAENYITIQTNDYLDTYADGLKPQGANTAGDVAYNVTITVNIDDDKIYNDGLPITITIIKG